MPTMITRLGERRVVCRIADLGFGPQLWHVQYTSFGKPGVDDHWVQPGAYGRTLGEALDNALTLFAGWRWLPEKGRRR